MKKTYSKEELRSMWNSVKEPTQKEIIEMIENQKEEVKEFQNVILRKLLEIYEMMNSLKMRIEKSEGLGSVEDVVKLEVIPKEEAKVRIKGYVDQHQGCRTSDIIYDLGLDPDLVLSILKELKEEGKIKGESVE